MQYKKLFDKSEIEYITPFLKLWMAFNNRYKKDLPTVRTDRDAINTYKNGGAIKTEFTRLLQGRSNEEEKFQDALAGLVKNVIESPQYGFIFPSDLFIRNPSNQTITRQGLVYISPHSKEFYYTNGDEDRLFENILEIIYQIRCLLVHGDFDIDDLIFVDFIEKTYRILYPIMGRILQNTIP